MMYAARPSLTCCSSGTIPRQTVGRLRRSFVLVYAVEVAGLASWQHAPQQKWLLSTDSGHLASTITLCLDLHGAHKLSLVCQHPPTTFEATPGRLGMGHCFGNFGGPGKSEDALNRMVRSKFEEMDRPPTEEELSTSGAA